MNTLKFNKIEFNHIGERPTSSIKLQEKSVTITENGSSEVKADNGYDGLSKVKVDVNVVGDASDGNENSPIYYKGINLEKEQIKEVDSVVSISYVESLLYKATINLSGLDIKAEGVLNFNNIPLENTPLSYFSDYIEYLTFYVFNPKSENLNLESGFILEGFFQIKINYNGIMYYMSDSILVVDTINTDTQTLEKLDIYFGFNLS